MMINKIFVSILLSCVISSFAYKSYENYKVFKVVPDTEVQVQILTDLRKSDYDIWNDVVNVGDDVRILVSPQQEVEFTTYLRNAGIKAEIAIGNVQELINNQLKPSNSTRSTRLGSFSWDRYHTIGEIHGWLDELEILYPNIVETVVIGQSLEGREIKGVVIDFRRGERDSNPLSGMIEGGIHAREWISPATVTWIIREFLTSTNADIRFLAETFVWHIFPIVNPDGYAYTFTNNRMWRKNRNPANHVMCGTNDDIGNGIDLNRNFNYLWMTTGASSNPCAETFAGPTATSEPEAQAITNYVTQINAESNMIYYFAFHSYGQMILVPYSHVSGTNVLEADNYADLYEIAIRGAAKLTSLYGTQYTVGTSAAILYPVSGSSFDWVKGVANVPIVYLFELRDLAQFGFLLEPEQIIPNNEEIMACLVEMDKTTRALRYYNGSQSIAASLVLTLFAFIYSSVM